MRKSDQLGVRWSPERKRMWETLCEQMGAKPSVLAGQILEEYMACFLTEKELANLGLGHLVITKPGPHLAFALGHRNGNGKK